MRRESGIRKISCKETFKFTSPCADAARPGALRGTDHGGEGGTQAIAPDTARRRGANYW